MLRNSRRSPSRAAGSRFDFAALGLDLVLLGAIALVGLTVARIAPALLGAYAGLVLLFAWWMLARAAAPREEL